MSLRRKLLLLLLALGTFAVVAATSTIYAVRWQVSGAAARFEQAMGRAVEVDRLGLELERQLFYLRQVVEGAEDSLKPYFQARDAFYTRLLQVASFAADLGDEAQAREVLRLADELEAQVDRCLSLAESGRAAEARAVLDDYVQAGLAPALSSRLVRARLLIDDARNGSTRQLGAITRRTFALTLLISGGAACLVFIGAMLVRRWLMAPIAVLQEATTRYTAGHFEHRCAIRGGDELGRLGAALNHLAQRVSEARDGLLASERKYRSLFSNLRDAVVLCDPQGRVLEYHDSDARLLSVEGRQHAGRQLLEVWPEWSSVLSDWPAALQAAAGGKRFHLTAVSLPAIEGGRLERFVDFLIYPIDVEPGRQIAVVARDVTAWQRLQHRVRRAETMEAVGTLAGGLAHDFNNLLASVTTTLAMLADDLHGSGHEQRIDTALRACRQAAGLSRRLLNFASSAHGDPQRFCMGEMAEVILNALDPSFLEGVELHRALEVPAAVRMDRDQFTQVVLNLIRNAREAMPDGGRLAIRVEYCRTRDPDDGGQEQDYAVLAVEDTGEGIPPEIQRHVFEPMFTTKSRATGRGRGLGLAIVYSAVKNAGGFVRLSSVVGQGTTFRVHLPVVEGPGRPLPAVAPAAVLPHSVPVSQQAPLMEEAE